MHIKSDPKDTVPFLGEDMSAAMIEGMMGAAELEAKARLSIAKKDFDQVIVDEQVEILERPKGEGLSAKFVEDFGREDDRIACYGRMSDLIVISLPNINPDIASNLVLNSIVFETGRPVLLLPPCQFEVPGRRIVISWNGSAQSVKAVLSALPLLKRAELVTAVAVGTQARVLDEAAQLGAYLRWHGIKTETRSIKGAASALGGEILSCVEEVEGDLLVVGAYTHSRMRQLLLGGVTSYVLDNSEVPLLMAH